MAPRGARSGGAQPSRGSKATSMKSSAGSRGGIHKKRAGATKIDGDGDLDMDSAARRSARSAAAQPGGGQSKPSTRSSATKSARGPSKVAQNIMKQLANGNIGDSASRVTRGRAKTGAGLSYLRVYGLRQSKASSNPDGGVKDLLSFLERKASGFTAGRSRRNPMIKKVCDDIDHVSGRTEIQQLFRMATCQARRSAQDMIFSAHCKLHQLNAPKLSLVSITR